MSFVLFVCFYFWTGRKYTVFLFCCFLIANEVTMFFVCSIASWVDFFFLSLHLTATSRRDQDESGSHGERAQPLYLSHYLHSRLFCAWQHNYQSWGPVQLKSQWLLTVRARVRGNAAGMRQDLNKGVLIRSVLVSRQRWQGRVEEIEPR